VAEQEVQAAINGGGAPLAPSRFAPTRPIYSKSNSGRTRRSSRFALTSTTLPLSKVEDLAETSLSQKDFAVVRRGASSVFRAAQRPAVGACRPTPRSFASYGMSLEDLRTALSHGETWDQAKGFFRTGPHQAYTIGDNDQLASSAGIQGRSSSAYRNGNPIRLRDVGERDRRARENINQAGVGRSASPSGHSEHPAPAGRQHHRPSSTKVQDAAAAPGGLAAVRSVSVRNG